MDFSSIGSPTGEYSSDPEMVESPGFGGRHLVGDEGEETTRSGSDGLNAKDNFECERTVRYRQKGKKR
jgi:hypothetical protein